MAAKFQVGIIGLGKGYYQAPMLAWCSADQAHRAAVTINKLE